MKARPYIQSINFKNKKDIVWDKFPFNIPAVKSMDSMQFHKNITFLVGENGSGKSTVLEAIAMALGFGQEGGTKNVLFKTVDTSTGLANNIRLVKGYEKPKDEYYLRAESFYNIASYMDEVGYLAGYGGKSLHARSHGEAFLAVLQNKLKGRGLYLLDEPEAALSPSRLMTALVELDRLVKKDSQFIIATHSPILLAYPNAKIIHFGADGIADIKYEDTEHFQLTKNFLNNPNQWIQTLLNDDA